MTSKKINQTIFRIKKQNTYDNFNSHSQQKNLFNFIRNKLKYLNINLFNIYPYSNKLNILIWTKKNEKIYMYVKKKKKNTKKKIIITKKYINLPNLKNSYSLQELKLLLLKKLILKYFSKKKKINFINFNKTITYCNYTKIYNNKKINFLVNRYLKAIRFPTKFKKIQIQRRNLLTYTMIFAGLTNNASLIAKTIANALNENKNQKAILGLIEFIITKVFVVSLNFDGLMVQINGKFLKKFGNKKIRATKQKFVVGKHIARQTLHINSSYGFAHAKTYLGVLGIHVWIKL